jgi:acyl carrier protein
MLTVATNAFLLRLEKLMELDPGTLTGVEALHDLERWDSMTVLLFMAMMDEQYGIAVSPSQLAHCTTVADLLALRSQRPAA